MSLCLRGFAYRGGNMSLRVREGDTCPAGLGRGKHALVRLV